MQVFPSYHIYPPTAPHVAYMQPKANAPSFFMADELRQVISDTINFVVIKTFLLCFFKDKTVMLLCFSSGVDK